MRRLTCLSRLAPAILAAAAATSVWAAPPAAGAAPLPAEVRKAIAALDARCRALGGSPDDSPHLAQGADLNGDGVMDYVVDINAYNCDGAPAALGAAATGGGVTVYVGGPNNTARAAWIGAGFGVKVEGAGPRPVQKPRVWLDIVGADCGQANAAALPMSSRRPCSRPLTWNPTTLTFAYAPLSEARASWQQ